MYHHPHIRLSSVVLGLSSTLDLVNWFVVDHHRQVTSFVDKMASEAGFSEADRSSLLIAAALHDIGAISFNEKFELAFETQDVMRHAELGYQLLRHFKPFHEAAKVVRHHHVPWNRGQGAERHGHPVPLGSHLLYLADRASVLIRSGERILRQVRPICDAVLAERDRMFHPELVDVFLSLAEREYFWLDAESSTSDFTIADAMGNGNIELEMPLLLDLSELFRMIIDFRSPNTATHSKDVAHLAAAIARLLGFSEREAETLRIAGNLHDLGKLAVPVELIDKQGPLDTEELFLMRSHSFHTYRILKRIGGLDDVIPAAALHHECLDGTGYPFHFTEGNLPLGARIIAVADALSALTENRSYRKAMEYAVALTELRRMAKARKLDPMIVDLVEKRSDLLRDVRDRADNEGMREFRNIRSESETAEERAQAGQPQGE